MTRLPCNTNLSFLVKSLEKNVAILAMHCVYHLRSQTVDLQCAYLYLFHFWISPQSKTHLLLKQIKNLKICIVLLSVIENLAFFLQFITDKYFFHLILGGALQHSCHWRSKNKAPIEIPPLRPNLLILSHAIAAFPFSHSFWQPTAFPSLPRPQQVFFNHYPKKNTGRWFYVSFLFPLISQKMCPSWIFLISLLQSGKTGNFGLNMRSSAFHSGNDLS